MISNSEIKDGRELLILLEKAIIIFASERGLCKKIDELISKFETGEPVYGEEIKDTIDVMYSIHLKKISNPLSKDKNIETNNLIVDFFEAIGMGWIIRNSNN